MNARTLCALLRAALRIAIRGISPRFQCTDNGVKWRALAVMACVSIGLLESLSASTIGPVVIGPGSHPLLYVTADENYHVLNGTEIISPSRTGPPQTFVVVTDAIEFRGGGHIRIDGGYFRGGDATFTGGTWDSARTSGGDALHLRHSTGEIHGGAFIGGDAVSTSRGGSGSGGDGLILVNSDITIYDGYFQGGTSTKPDLYGDLSIFQAAAINAYDGSDIVMHGGHAIGRIDVFIGATLSIFGRNLSYEGSALSGRYANGESFSHLVPRSGGIVVLNEIIPEPAAFAIAASGLIAMPLIRRRRKQKLSRS